MFVGCHAVPFQNNNNKGKQNKQIQEYKAPPKNHKLHSNTIPHMQIKLNI